MQLDQKSGYVSRIDYALERRSRWMTAPRSRNTASPISSAIPSAGASAT